MFFLVVGCFIALTYYAKYQEHLKIQHHLFCEVLKPGMSEDEALQALRPFGELHVVELYPQNPHSLDINFSDGKGGNIGGAVLYFFDHKYDSAYTRSFDSLETLCDFSQPTPISP